MPKKKKNQSSKFSLKTKATHDLDELMRQQLEADIEDRPLNQVFNMFANKDTGEPRYPERMEDEKHVDMIDELDRTEKDNNERTRWY